MSSHVSLISQGRSAANVLAPPPLPPVQRGASSHLFDDTEDDMRRLTADITRVLTGRPDLRIVGAIPVGPAAAAGVEPALADEAGHLFEWQALDAEQKPHAAAEHAAGWLSRARRERRYRRLRAALSWCVALGIAGIIIAAVAGSVRGGLALLGVIGEIGRTLGL